MMKMIRRREKSRKSRREMRTLRLIGATKRRKKRKLKRRSRILLITKCKMAALIRCSLERSQKSKQTLLRERRLRVNY